MVFLLFLVMVVLIIKEVYDFLVDMNYSGWIVVEAEQDPKI